MYSLPLGSPKRRETIMKCEPFKICCVSGLRPCSLQLQFRIWTQLPFYIPLGNFVPWPGNTVPFPIKNKVLPNIWLASAEGSRRLWYEWIPMVLYALTTLVVVFHFDFFSSNIGFHSQCRRLFSHFYGTFCVLSYYTTLPLVRLLQLPAVQCCCHFLTDFGWKGRLVSIPMVDCDRIFLLYLLYHCFPILVRCFRMPVWLEGYMLICWVRLERLALTN